MGIGGSRHVVPLQYKGVDHVQSKKCPLATDLYRWSLEVCNGCLCMRVCARNIIYKIIGIYKREYCKRMTRCVSMYL